MKEVYVLHIHYCQNGYFSAEFEGVYETEYKADKAGKEYLNGYFKNKGRTSFVEPFFIESNEFTYSVIKTLVI